MSVFTVISLRSSPVLGIILVSQQRQKSFLPGSFIAFFCLKLSCELQNNLICVILDYHGCSVADGEEATLLILQL